MKTYNDIMTVLKDCEQELLQVSVFSNALGEQDCVIIFDTDPADIVQRMRALRRHLALKRLPMPLIVNREFVLSALDSYPLEFLNISMQYRNIFCKYDLLAELKYNKADMRLQIERELKSKWLLTRMAILERAQGSRRLARLLRKSVNSIFPALKGFSYLAGMGVPSGIQEIVNNVAQITGLKLDIITQLSVSKQSDSQEALQYLEVLHRLDLALDKIPL
ncbi:MAG TPA: hypothetical protein P5533_03405 [Candidatus Cloacimonadota bacterium]|nr:hypothetical protein [Candidatus Cloacimonadota bacterium]